VLRDFLNLLTVITGYAEFSLYGLDEGEDVRERIQEIRRGAERATHLVYTCLSVGRRETPSSARILDLNQSLKDAEKVLEPLTGDNTVMELHLHSSLLPVRMCPAELERVILNLVINAREAMPDGGTVTIQTANMLIDNQAIASQIGVATGQYVTLLLSDTGIGMDVETRRHLFEPFFTTKENHRGLGLATVRGIVKQSAGGIVVESESGQGTRVTVYLPAVMQGAVVAVNASPQLVRSLAGTETILVADANLQMRILVRKMLEHAGYRVLEAESGKPAFNIPDGIESPIDLLLTEVGMRGRLLASQLQRRNPKVKILYMCRHDDNEVRPLAEGKAYIQKPFSPHILWHMIRGLLDRT
jgi:CheY-like chemotaxis protein